MYFLLIAIIALYEAKLGIKIENAIRKITYFYVFW